MLEQKRTIPESRRKRVLGSLWRQSPQHFLLSPGWIRCRRRYLSVYCHSALELSPFEGKNYYNSNNNDLFKIWKWQFYEKINKPKIKSVKIVVYNKGKNSSIVICLPFRARSRILIPYPLPPPPPVAKLFIPLQFRTPVRTHLHTANQRPRVLICIQPIHRGWFNPRYKLVRPPLQLSTARGAVGKAACSTALHCLFSGCEFKSSCWLFFCYNKMGNNGVYSVRGGTQMMK